MTKASANGGGVAFFAHVGGFLFGLVVTTTIYFLGRDRMRTTSHGFSSAPNETALPG